MRHSTHIFVFMTPLFFVGVVSLFHFSQNVRLIDAVGLASGGATCGAALVGVIVGLVWRIRRPEEKGPPAKQPPPL
jgi:hypothetical protein